jgi:hypothetical protein
MWKAVECPSINLRKAKLKGIRLTDAGLPEITGLPGRSSDYWIIPYPLPKAPTLVYNDLPALVADSLAVEDAMFSFSD